MFDAMDVRVTAAAVRAYSKAAKDRSLEIEAVAIRTRAERRLGQVLQEGRERGEVAAHGRERSKVLVEDLTLTDIGVTKNVSARSGILARMDDDEYAATESAWRENMATAVRVTLPKVGEPRDPVEPPPPPAGQYSVVVVDPPWPMKPVHVGDASNRPDIGYPTMTVDGIAAMELPATDAHVFLWTTQRFLPDAFRCFEAWGVRYVCLYFWIKPDGPKPLGLPKYNVEPMLYGRIGKPYDPRDQTDWWAGFTAPRGAHSEKPGLFYETLRRVYDGPRIDMFSRRRIPGFEAWGAEAE